MFLSSRIGPFGLIVFIGTLGTVVELDSSARFVDGTLVVIGDDDDVEYLKKINK